MIGVEGEWGLLDPVGTNPIAEYLTMQRVNYTEEDLPASAYGAPLNHHRVL